jgi:hypothetical protein
VTRRLRALQVIAFGTFALLTSTFLERKAFADPPTVESTLSYARGVGAESCPDDAAFRSGVARRLGYDPFRSEARSRVEVTLARSASGFSAHIVIGGVDGVADASRDLSTEGGSCDELVDSIVLAVSLAIDPVSFAHPHPAIAKLPVQEPPPPPVAPPPPPPENRSLWNLDLTGVARAGVGLVPGVSLGPIVGVGARRKGLEIFVDGGVDLPLGSVSVTGGESPVEATLLHAGAGACAHVLWIALCGHFDAGSLNGTTTVTHISSAKLYADVAASAGVDTPLGYGFRLDAGLEAVLPLETIDLYAGPLVWKTPTLAGALFVGVGYRL